jgi:hypothetical protein
MSRLFITQKEIQYHTDVTQEMIKDIIGQKIYYFPMSTNKSLINETYDEAIEKVYDGPIEIDALVGQPEWENVSNNYGTYLQGKLEVFFQGRDLNLKSIKLAEGDFFTYGSHTYEIVVCVPLSNLWGQEEYDRSFRISAITARPGRFDPSKYLPPASEPDDVQEEFVQQRGLKETKEGITNDIREMRERLGEEMAPIALGEGPRIVNQDSQSSIEPVGDDKVNTFLIDDEVDDEFYQ